MVRVKLFLLDIALVVVATAGAMMLRSNLTFSDGLLDVPVPYMLATLISAGIAFSAFGTSSSVWRLATMPEYVRVIGAVIATVLSAVALTFVYSRMEGVARSLPILQGLVMIVVLCGARAATRLRYKWRSRQRPVGGPMVPLARPSATTVLLVGLNPLSEFYTRAAAEFDSQRVRIVGILGRTGRHVGRTANGYAVLGTPEDVQDVLRDLDVHGIRVDQIVVTVPHSQFDGRAKLAVDAAVVTMPHIKLVYLEDLLGITRADMMAGDREGVSTVAAEVGVSVTGPPEVATVSDHRSPNVTRAAPIAPQSVYWRVKPIVDRIAALILLIIFAPAIALVALIVALDVGAPIVFWQCRPGRFGRPFNIYKFRTMRKSYDSHGTRLSDAERFSRIGHCLRICRLDELPQLWNILVGEMAFIGPRPLLPVDQSDEYSARLLVLPGLTGWAQVTGGRTVSAREKAALDIWYVHNASFGLDIKILLLTVRMVAFGEVVDRDAISKASAILASR